MKIETLDDLSKLIVLCRKKGLKGIEIDNIKFQFDEVYTPPKIRKVKAVKENTDYHPPTQEEILFWSAGVSNGQ